MAVNNQCNMKKPFPAAKGNEENMNDDRDKSFDNNRYQKQLSIGNDDYPEYYDEINSPRSSMGLTKNTLHKTPAKTDQETRKTYCQYAAIHGFTCYDPIRKINTAEAKENDQRQSSDFELHKHKFPNVFQQTYMKKSKVPDSYNNYYEDDNNDISYPQPNAELFDNKENPQSDQDLHVPLNKKFKSNGILNSHLNVNQDNENKNQFDTRTSKEDIGRNEEQFNSEYDYNDNNLYYDDGEYNKGKQIQKRSYPFYSEISYPNDMENIVLDKFNSMNELVDNELSDESGFIKDKIQWNLKNDKANHSPKSVRDIW